MPDVVILPDLDKRSDRLTLTPEVATAIVAALEAGSSRRGAAHLNSIPEATFRRWLDWANEGVGEPYISLLDRVLKAEAYYESTHIQAAQTVATKSDEHLNLLKSHPAHRDQWASKQDEQRGITVQVGFVLNAAADVPLLVAAEPAKLAARTSKRRAKRP